MRPLRPLLASLLLLLAILPTSPVARAAGTAGQFDFYVLSLSWSPSYCEATGDQRKDVQCARPFGFVVHGLWPQYDRGFPSDCAYSGRLPDALIKAQLDLFPAFGLVIHEWRKHGTCSGLSPDAYFQAVRKAFSAVAVPAAYGQLSKPQMADTKTIEADFITANKGLDGNEVAVVCDSRRLTEVRICINKDLKTFHACPQVNNASCRLGKVYMPAIRTGGN
jgi:ribonuclease T2